MIGHSEGSLIGMVAARQAVADAFVSIAGAGRPAAEILRGQLQRALPSGLYGRSEEILQSIERGDTVAEVPAELAALFRPSVQPYLISWFPYAPADEIGKLEVPVLVVQGTTDVQVGEEEARALAGGSSGSRLVVIEGMNHVLKQVSGGVADQQSSYFDPALPIVPELVEAVRRGRKEEFATFRWAGEPPDPPPPMSQMVSPASQRAVKRSPSRTKTSWTYGCPMARTSTSRGLAGSDRSTITSFAGWGSLPSWGSMLRKAWSVPSSRLARVRERIREGVNSDRFPAVRSPPPDGHVPVRVTLHRPGRAPASTAVTASAERVVFCRFRTLQAT